jgi:hypothetical protein
MEDYNPGKYLKNPRYKNTHTSESVHFASDPTDCDIATEHVKKELKNHGDTVSSQQQINK